jgi:hypothetical protein
VERQRLTQWWIRLLIALPAALGWWAFLQQIAFGRPWGSKPMSDAGVVVFFVVIGIGVPLLFLLMRLDTTVSRNEVCLRWWPLWTRRIPLARITAHEAVTYRPILHYGGFGIRFAWRRGWAWNAAGNRGVRLTLDPGRPVLIGSQRAEALDAALDAALAAARGSTRP